MSLRSASRITRPALARTLPRVQIIPRRLASTSVKKGSDAPWLIGSAAVFGGLGAFILLGPSKEVSHSIHDKIDKKAHAEHAPVASSPDNAMPSEKPTTPEPETPIPNEPRGPIEKAVKPDLPADSHADKKPGVNTQSKNDDSKGPGGTEGRESAVEGDSGDDKKEEKSAGRGDEPSQDEVRSSIQRAEKTDTPLIAESEEEKGNQTQAETSK